MEVCGFAIGRTSQRVLTLLEIRGTLPLSSAVVDIASITEVGLYFQHWKY